MKTMEKFIITIILLICFIFGSLTATKEFKVTRAVSLIFVSHFLKLYSYIFKLYFSLY